MAVRPQEVMMDKKSSGDIEFGGGLVGLPPGVSPEGLIEFGRGIFDGIEPLGDKYDSAGGRPLWARCLKDGSELILIPSGEFTMGSNDYDDEKPPHKVYLDAYYIGKHEVTNEQFAKFVQETSYQAQGSWRDYYKSGTAKHPVVSVTWNDAKAYCDWAGLRLPTEAEWEKAARGTDGRKYPWGNEWDASRCNNNSSGTKPVGSFSSGASPYGCLDMAGNVWEWCSDWYGDKYYSQSPSSDPQGPGSGSSRVLRGGSWLVVYPVYFRCSLRCWYLPADWYNSRGFRVARALNIV